VLLGGDGGFCNFFQRQVDGGEALELGAKDVGREGKKPCGEAGFLTPLGEAAPCAQKGLLGHLLSAAAIAAVAPCHVDERALPAANDSFEGLDIACKHAGYVGKVFCCDGRSCCQVKRSPWGETGGRGARLHFLAGKEIGKKMQPGPTVSGPTGCEGKNPEQLE